VFANDWDVHASSIYRTAYGSEVFHQGDIHDLVDQVPDHDLLTGGFPCQPFSYAGHKRGLADSRADTLGVISHVLATRRPRAFVLENVRSLLTLKHGDHFKIVLSQLVKAGYSLEWRTLNAMDCGLPQNRNRILFVGFPNDSFPTHSLLGDELEWHRFRQDSVDRRDGALSKWAGSFPSWGRLHENYIEGSTRKRQLVPPANLRDWLDDDVNSRYDFTANTLKRIPQSTPIHQIIDHVQVLYNQEGGRRMGYTIFGIEGVAPTLTCTTSRHYERFHIGNRYRRLTPEEYERLQGFPVGISKGVPHAKRYVALGNAIPPGLARIGLEGALSVLAMERQPVPAAS
jgi:DNA (cytosine-5)-methyltransferase 1